MNSTRAKIELDKPKLKPQPNTLPNGQFYEKPSVEIMREKMIEMVNKKHLNKNDWNRTIFIDSGDVGTTEFKLKQDKIDFLIHSGVKGVDDYFLWKNNDLVWKQYPK
jgi:hypothetical protein